MWVKRNDYVIVQTGIDKPPDEEAEGEAAEDQIAEASTSDDPNESGIRFIINHILYKDQVKHLLSKGLWPKHDPEFSSETTGNSSSEPEPSNDDGIVYNTEDNYDDGIVYTEYDMDNDDDLFVNTNRITRLEIQDSESEEESSDEEDWKGLPTESRNGWQLCPRKDQPTFDDTNRTTEEKSNVAVHRSKISTTSSSQPELGNKNTFATLRTFGSR